MVRNYIVKFASLLMLLGFAAGVALQVELLKPGISFMNQTTWSDLLTLHTWLTPLSLITICISTISFIRYKSALGQWAIWFSFAMAPVLLGVLMHLIHSRAQSGAFLADTIYLTAYRHSFGIAILLVALGGLSAMKKAKFENMSLKISLGFALLITASGVVLIFLQASLGLNGMPRRYIDYPDEFSQLQFFSSIAAITCLMFSIFYVILLWLYPVKKTDKIEELFE